MSIGNELVNDPQNDANKSDMTTESVDKLQEKKLTLEYYGIDLTKEAKDNNLDPVIGRESEIDQMIFTLLRKTKNNPLLIGEAGVGKTAVVEGFATRIIQGKVPEKLKNKKVFLLDMGSLLAGTKYRGEFESRLKTILEEASDPINNIILFIDEIHTIIGAGNSEGGADAANMLKPMLARGKVKLIGATTFDEYQKHIEKDPALKRRFQEINVLEPSFDVALLIMNGLKKYYEEHHGVQISDDAILSSIQFSKRYILNKQLPDKAIDLLDEACARKSVFQTKLEENNEYLTYENDIKNIQEKLEKSIEKQDYFLAAELKKQLEELKRSMKNVKTKNSLPVHLRPEVTREDIGFVIAQKLGVPYSVVTESEIHKLKSLDSELKKSILGQDDVIESIVKVMKRSRLSVIERNKPIASFMFLGPSGVGKTHVAKTIAKDYFADEKALIRVDMSEFMEKYSVSKLIGSAPGYVGYEEGGLLTESVRRRPYSVILFDEIEKASRDVLNILLQIMDEGHLKDNKGRIIDFKNTIIILTSNLGSEEFSKKVSKIGFNSIGDGKDNKFDFEAVKTKVMEHVKSFMSPELLNRLDYSIIFHPLDKESLKGILKKELTSFLSIWKKHHGDISIPKFTDLKLSKIIDEIYDPQFGARPVFRYIHDKIEPALIESVLNKKTN